MGIKGEKGEPAQGYNSFGGLLKILNDKNCVETDCFFFLDEGLNYQKPILGTVTFQNTDSMIKVSLNHLLIAIDFLNF